MNIKKLYKLATFLGALAVVVVFSYFMDNKTLNKNTKSASADVPYSQASYYSQGWYGDDDGGGDSDSDSDGGGDDGGGAE